MEKKKKNNNHHQPLIKRNEAGAYEVMVIENMSIVPSFHSQRNSSFFTLFFIKKMCCDFGKHDICVEKKKKDVCGKLGNLSTINYELWLTTDEFALCTKSVNCVNSTSIKALPLLTFIGCNNKKREKMYF